jgi:glycosyltransferase involved in cell wall biosynthesis
MGNLSDRKKMIHHCSWVDITKGGGIETYVCSLLQSKMPEVSDRVLTTLKDVAQNQFKLLHLHASSLLAELQNECPAIYTLHNHSAYCPSGNKYLARMGAPCDRQMSYFGCGWGHLVDGCGSRRPQNIIRNLQSSHQELETLKKLKITVIANSDYIRGQLIEHGLPPEKVVTLHCGISQPQNHTEPLSLEIHQNQRILFLGRIVPNKGLEWLLKALAQTEQQIKLDIAGEGWDRPRMEKLAQNLGISDRITWHGWCNSEKVDLLYQKCLAVIFPSLWHEPAGLVTLEAYARYRPVIASAVGGIPEYLRHKETGMLVPANDIQQLAATIAELAINYQKTTSLGQQGHAEFIKKFTLDIHVRQLQKIYKKAISDFYA